MFSPSAVAILNNTNYPLLLKTSLDTIDPEKAIKLEHLLYVSVDIVEDKSLKPTSRDNFLGILDQFDQIKIYGFISTTKTKILLMIDGQTCSPRENDVKLMLKSIHKVFVESTVMNPFYKPNEPVKSKRLEQFLDTIFSNIAKHPMESQFQQQLVIQ